MSGVKGRSGPRIKSVIEKRHRIIDKAWERTENIIDDKKNKMGDTAALQLATRDMPEKQEHSGTINVLPPLIIRGKKAEYEIGD